jgi:peptidase S24-like protein
MFRKPIFPALIPNRQARARRARFGRPAKRAELSRSSAHLTNDGQRRLVLEVLGAGGRMWVRGGGSSMHPTIRAGERVLLEPVCGRPSRGEIVAFRRRSRIFVHRVIRVTDGGILTRGDALLSCDEPVTWDSIIGMVTAVERHGHVMALRPTVRHGVVALVLFGLHSIRNAVAHRLRRRKR